VRPELQFPGRDGKAGIPTQLHQRSQVAHHSALALEPWICRHSLQELLEGLTLHAQPLATWLANHSGLKNRASTHNPIVVMNTSML
jgi:hypothetical protein